MNEFFKPAGDLDDVKVNDSNDTFNDSMGEFFRPAGDLSDIKTDNYEFDSSNISVDNINNYLTSIVSGEKFEFQCELGKLCGEGSMIVSFEKLVSMVDSGNFNIVSANCISPDMIDIKYQEYSKEYKMRF